MLSRCPCPLNCCLSHSNPPPAACRDMGTVVMGKSEAGVVKKGDTLMVMPNK
jgi:translation elongation factor EF-1alpha